MKNGLTEEQAIAFEKVLQFLHSPGGGVFLLKGYAGTGKTYVLQKLAEYLSKEKLNFFLLAPTGRAAGVLKSKTTFNATTVHSHLYRFSDIDGEIESTELELTSQNFGQMRLLFGLKPIEPEKKAVFIVDEASMISDEPGDPTSYAHFGSGHLLSDLLQTVSINKLILAGDPAQLPPINQDISPALDAKYLRKLGKIVHEVELRKILRQKESSGVLELASKVRNIIDHGYFPKWLKLPARNINNIELLPENELLLNYINSVVEGGNPNSIAICHSNFACHRISKQIRLKKYGAELAPLQTGDLLLVTQNNYPISLTNGDFVKVIFVGENIFHQGISFTRIRVKAIYTGQEHETLLCADTLFNNRANLTSDQQRLLMIDFSLRMRSKNVKPKSEAYYRALEKDPYLNSLRANFGHAVTCHKSQGGEWDTVYLFLNKGMYSMRPESLARWWYTAVTRAKVKLFVTYDWWIS